MQCSCCKEEKPLEAFYTSPSLRRARRCRECHRKQTREWDKANPTKQRKRVVRWQQEHAEEYIAAKAKHRTALVARRLGVTREQAHDLQELKHKCRTADPRAKALFNGAWKRATSQGLDCTITPLDIELPTHCPILGLELAYRGYAENTGRRFMLPNSASLDRVDTTKGYVPGNIAVISMRANSLKGAATPEEHERIIEWLRAQLRTVKAA